MGRVGHCLLNHRAERLDDFVLVGGSTYLDPDSLAEGLRKGPRRATTMSARASLFALISIVVVPPQMAVPPSWHSREKHFDEFSHCI